MMELPPPDLKSSVIDSTMRRLEVESYTAGAVRSIVAAEVLAEREACANLCHDEQTNHDEWFDGYATARSDCAFMIRARGTP
jgi:hypothetical protein